jgi:hypothetical protein
LLVKFRSRFARQEKVDRIRVAGAVVTGETIHVHAEEDAADVDGDFIDEIEAIKQIVVVRIRRTGARVAL